MYRFVFVFLLLPLLTAGEVPFAAKPWAAVERLANGERIEVQLTAGKFLKGTLDRVSAEAIYIRRRDKTIEIGRREVNRVYRRNSGAGTKWVIIGGAIGAGAGAGVGAAIMERKSGYGGAVAGTAALVGLVGAGVGYALGHGHSVLIYQAPTR